MDEKKNYLFDRDGNKLSVRELDALLKDVDYCRVALTVIGDIEVSTVWTGICNEFSLGYMQARRVFETIAFDHANGSVSDPVRVATESQALAAHEDMCEEIKTGKGI
jgi:hypothetical protein